MTTNTSSPPPRQRPAMHRATTGRKLPQWGRVLLVVAVGAWIGCTGMILYIERDGVVAWVRQWTTR
jgi:hypothetical protein